MKDKFIHILMYVALFAFSLYAYADTEFQLMQLTTADGLANNTVRHIMQDSKGRIWICTSNGVSLYDGTSFTNFHPLRDKSKVSLNDQRTKQAHESDGLLWIQTAKDFSCYDLNRNCFIDFEHNNIKVPTFPKSNYQEITDKQGRTWRVTENEGLYIINNKTGETEHFTTTSKNNPLPTNALKCIFQDKEGVIWIGTDNLGISQIKVVQNDGVKYMFEGENIRLLTHIGDGKIAVGNRNGEVRIYDSTLTTLLSSSQRAKNTYCAMLDKENNLWEGTKGDGLYINGTQVQDSLFREIYSIFQDRNDRIWIGTFGEGLFHENKSYFTNDYSSKRIRKIISDKSGNIWVATSNGIYTFDSSALIKNPKDFTHLNLENNHLYSNEIRTIFRDSRDNIYVAETGEGFALLPSSFILTKDMKAISHFGTSDSLINNMVQSFVEDKDGFIWISTEFGISKFSPTKRTFKNYFFSKNMLNNVYNENCGIALSDGRIAFGTNNGLIIITPYIYNKGEKSTQISADDITINGQPVKRGIIYVVSKWWKSPWAIAIYIVLAITGTIIWRRIRKNNSRFHKTIKELNIKKDKLIAEKEVIIAEKEEIIAEKEEIKEHYSTEIKMRREAEKSAFEEEFISKLETITNRELSNPEFSADNFAEQMGMGRTVFFNKIKTITGYSPKEYIKLKRIKKAAELISTTTMTISEIAIIVGIDDPLYFSRVFKQQYGMSPTEWRTHSTTA